MSDLPDEASELLLNIASLTMDKAMSMAFVVVADGTVDSMPLQPSPFSKTGKLVRSTYVPRTNRLFLQTDSGHAIEVELPKLRDSSPRVGRPVVYLDQRDWSLLASAIFDPERIKLDKHRGAADYLVGLARAQKIILPMSFGHLGETSK